MRLPTAVGDAISPQARRTCALAVPSIETNERLDPAWCGDLEKLENNFWRSGEVLDSSAGDEGMLSSDAAGYQLAAAMALLNAQLANAAAMQKAQAALKLSAVISDGSVDARGQTG